MSAPLLTPLDTPIFDEDVLGHIEEHADDAPTCDACERPAAVRFVHRCCGVAELVCAPHLEACERWLEQRSRTVHCTICKEQFLPPVSVEKVAKVVPL